MHKITPCTIVQETTVKEWFQKINEELDELKVEVFEATIKGDDYRTDIDRNIMDAALCLRSDTYMRNKVVNEAIDVCTVIYSLLEALGINETERDKAVGRANWKNYQRGRIKLVEIGPFDNKK